MKFRSTAAIPELLFVGKNAIITKAQDQSVIPYKTIKMKNKKKLIYLNTPKNVIIVTIILTTMQIVK
jgi:hypothetical protein